MPAGWLNIDAPGDTVFGGQKSAAEDLFGIKLGWRTRLYGFLACFVLGLALSILGVVWLFLGAYIIFATFFTIGIIVSLIGTGFLLGPKNQIQGMFKPVRLVATLILLISMAMAFMAAFLLKNAVLCLIMVIVEYVAYLWYCLSYIPYARDLAYNLLPNALKWK